MNYPSDPTVQLYNGKFTDGNSVGGIPASLDRATEMNAVFDELLALISYSHQTPNEAALSQVAAAVRRLAGAKVTTISAATALTEDQAGIILVNAAGAGFNVTLPTTPVLPACKFTFVRIDTASANSVSINAGSGDNVEGVASLGLGLSTRMSLIFDGTHAWYRNITPAKISEYYESAEITVATAVSVSHGLSGTPTLMQAVLRCKTTDLGYAVGDEVDVVVGGDAAGENIVAVWSNSTTLGLSVRVTTINIEQKAGGLSPAQITAANWKFVLRAWR